MFANENEFRKAVKGADIDDAPRPKHQEELRKRVLMAFDYDPASEPELQPMATAWLHHAFINDLRVYIVALWPIGQNMAEDTLNAVLPDYPDRRYGTDFVNLGFKSGGQGVINVILTDIRKMFPTDVNNRYGR